MNVYFQGCFFPYRVYVVMQIIVSCHFPAIWSNSKCMLIHH